jgi:hypothetical protein
MLSSAITGRTWFSSVRNTPAICDAAWPPSEANGIWAR